MTTLKDAAKSFLSLHRIAVAGVSRTKESAANLIYRKLRSAGYQVYAVNPNANMVEGDTCYPDLSSIPEQPEGVVIVTRPEVTENIVKECSILHISNVWMHSGISQKLTSVSQPAIEFCKTHGIHVIPGGCPMMYIDHADVGHRVMRWMKEVSGALPKTV